MNNISKKINDIEIIEYMYQLKISKYIKENNKSKNKELINKIEKMRDTKEQIIKRIINKEGM